MNQHYLALTISDAEYNDLMERHITEELVRLAMPSFGTKIHERWQELNFENGDVAWQFVLSYESSRHG